MNNPLKLFFLIFNLVPSLTSSVNDFYQPLSETELKMGQNASQIDKRDSKLILHSGMKVDGLTYNLPQTCQRPCTLSFPVSKKRFSKKVLKGFLTSANCVSTNILVGDTVVGIAMRPSKFDSEQGLDYTFVRIYSDYWWEDDILSDDNSNQVIYSHCVKSGRGIVDIDELLPIIPTPSQPLSVGDKVYAHGGDRGMVSGEILETGVTITVAKPGSCGKESAELHNVVRVKMNKSYYSGDLGAPVYISLQVPNSKQMIASPVGQVVEVYNWDIGTHVWYYIPLDRILKDSGLKIESGDLSSFLPADPADPEEPDNENLNNVPLDDDLTMSSNVSDVNLVERQQRQVLITHAGLDFFVSSAPSQIRRPGTLCTLGFAVKGIRGRGGFQFDHGFLTLGGCLPSGKQGKSRGYAAFHVRHRNQAEEVIGLGSVGSLKHEPARGLNYALVRLLPNNDERVLWDDDESIQIPVSEEVANVYNQARPQGGLSAGQELCWHGGCSGHRCGTIEHPSANWITINPWKWPIYIKAVLKVGNVRVAEVNLYSPEDHYEGLIKIRMNGPAPYRNDEFNCDRGSPVYFPYYSGHDRGRHINYAQPVGILLDYVQEYEDTGDRCEWVQYMYCISVHRIIHNSEFEGRDLQLYGENFA